MRTWGFIAEMGDEARMKVRPGQNASTEGKICSLGTRVGGDTELLRHSPLRNGAPPGGSTSLAKDVEGDKQATPLPIMGLSGTHPPSEVDVLAPWPV